VLLLADIVEVSRALAATRSRREKIDRLAALLGKLALDEVRPAVSYLSGVVPQGRLGVGWSALTSARPSAPAAAGPRLTVTDVDRSLGELAAAAGKGSAARRRELLGRLLAGATGDERDFLVRLLGGELRQGALEGIMVEAIARAASVAADPVRRALMLSGDLAEVAQAALSGGAGALGQFSLELFRPVLPMLAQPADDPGDAIERLGEAAFDYKLDGARVQLHRAGDEVRVFSRGLSDVTGSMPELCAAARTLAAREVILDGEAIALRPDGRPHSFQTTMRRFGRKHDVAAMQTELPLRGWFFDCLRLDGDTLLTRPTRERLAALESAVPPDLVIPRLVTGDPARAAELFERALAEGHEGLMAKSLDAPYQAGARGKSWLKLKRARTFDLVVLAVEWGSGRRRGWLSNLHLGARDPATGGFVMVGKTFKGMSDEMLAWQTERFLTLEVARDRHIVHLRPEQVVEVAISDVQDSPHYPGGIALRFARVKRYRPDKPAGEADTLPALRALLPTG
jgi:DNA ligase-1